jgi:outer membrane protein assembly factor BamB
MTSIFRSLTAFPRGRVCVAASRQSPAISGTRRRVRRSAETPLRRGACPAIRAALAVWIAAVSANAQDWPQWRGPDRDGKVNGFAAPRAWPGTLTQRWKITVGLGDATPALVGDHLFVFTRQGGDEVVLCLKAGDGKEIWQSRYEAVPVTGPAAQYRGPRSSPAVAVGKVLTLGVGGILSCLDAATGKVEWRQGEFSKVLPWFFTAMSPLLVDGLCMVHLGGKDNGTVAAIDLRTGQPAWRWTGDGPAYSSPVLMTVGGTKQVVVQTEKHLLGLAMADGKRLWQVRTAPESGYWNSVTPIIDGRTVIYSGQGKGTRAVAITREGADFAAKEIWSNPKLGTVYNTPVLKDGLLFGLSDRANLFCLNARTGETAWRGTNRVSQFGTILDAGSVLLALSEKAGLIAYRPSGQAYEELARFKVSDTPIYASPVVAGNRVFVKDAETVAMWTIE